MKKNIILSIFFILTFLATSTYAGSIFYSKPEYRGRIIDAETKQPIEGAVVVVLYYKVNLIGGPGGPNSYVFEAKETLTNKKGEFYFPAYSSLLLFTKDAGVVFIFFKPGYISINDRAIDTGIAGTRIGLNKYLATDIIGKEAEFTLNSFAQGKIVKWKGPLGIMELTKGERDPSTPTDYRSKELPLLFKALNEDRKKLGYQGELK